MSGGAGRGGNPMEVMSVGAGSFAHGVHYGVLVVGLLGLLALLGPQWVGDPRNRGPRDEHERRVADLHQRILTDSLGTTTVIAPPTAPSSKPVLGGALLPIAVVSSTAAAGVHGAVGPEHFRELFLFGMFFAATSLAQIAWSILMVLNPTRRLLVAGIAGNTALIVLWLITRSVGLPFGLMPDPEAIGAWDLCCAAWEAVVALAGFHALRKLPSAPLRLPGYDDWPRSARLWLYGSMVVLGALTLSGASG